jgi:hemerythrin superfamily protein
MRQNDVASQIQGFYQRWQQLKDEHARQTLARAIIDKISQAGKARDWAERPWFKDLLTYVEKHNH